jgi:2-C-methyl-D-erythritol 2,4-cyclodiphosphate synthase
LRIGIGYDSHRFDSSREMVLGGVVIPGHPGLTGHSDGDAIAHAIIDAILGAAAAGNVGTHFPPSDDSWKDADSIDLLRRSVAILAEVGYRIVNVDVTVVCETPKVGPYSEAMRDRLATAMEIAVPQVSIKGKSNEGMGWIGRGEGLAVHAVALIERGAASVDAGVGA